MRAAALSREPFDAAYVADYFGISIIADYDLSQSEDEDDERGGFVQIEGGDRNRIRKVMRLTNPNAKWDYYTEGGRWPDYLIGKDGRCHHRMRKSQIDVEMMREKDAQKAAADFDTAMRDVETPWQSWDALAKQHPADLDKAREIYHGQPQIKAIMKSLGPNRFFFDVDALLIGRDRYVERAREGALATFAFVQDRKWAERGEMGWWALVADEKDRDDWNAQFNAWFAALPDDTLLTVVDCHI